MTTKYTKEESDKKYLGLKDYLSKFKERESELLKKWFLYQKLNQSQVEELKSKWTKYYDDCRKTKVYELFRKQSVAFKAGEKQTVLDIAREMSRIREAGEFECQKPSSIDPDEMRRRLQPYWHVKDLLEGTDKSDPKEAQEIFGKKSGDKVSQSETESDIIEFAEKLFS